MTNMLPRSAWTNTPNKRRTPLLIRDTTSITLHYPAVGNITLKGESQKKTAARLEGWRKMHVNQNRWTDIGYNYAVDQAGRMWWLTGLNRGAHAGTNAGNSTSAAILLVLGNNENPSPEMIEGVRQIRAQILKTHYKATTVRGHRDWKSTACPGAKVYALIKKGEFSKKPTGGIKYINTVGAMTFNIESRGYDFNNRLNVIVNRINNYGLSILALQECYPEQKKYVKNALEANTNLRISSIYSGRAIATDPKRWRKVGKTKVYRVGPKKRVQIAAKYKDLTSGKHINIVCVHLTSGTTKTADAARKSEITQLIKLVDADFKFNRTFYIGDYNDSIAVSARPRRNVVGRVLSDNGYHDAAKDVNPTYGAYNTAHQYRKPAPRQGIWLDRFNAGRQVEFLTHKVDWHQGLRGSDHWAVVTTFRFPR